ncbi:MAG TPA: GNAT family N-acetyltransferase [Saprospiraceae bacterium]|nr:GNAT family N-acetyltransferase [Saprospiraceae bacterium]
MSSLIYTTAQTERDLLGIMELQKKNIAPHLTPEEMKSQGFLTVVHTLDDLKKMNDIEKHIICKDGENVVAYTLAMTVKSKNDLPILFPMFEKFEKIIYLDKPVSEFNYIIVGQACVDIDYRGQSVLDKCYEAFKNAFSKNYDFAISEISCRNSRSLRAHQRIGFSEIFIYTAPDGEEWSVVIWEW